jgi:hypothetical protein
MVRQNNRRIPVAFVGALSIALASLAPAVTAAKDKRDGGSVRQSRQVSASSKNVNVNRNNATRNTSVNRNANVNVNRNVDVNVNRRGGSYGRPGGTVIKGEEGAVGKEGAAVGRRGAVAIGEEGAVAVGRRGAVAIGEEGAVGVGRYGRVYATGNAYEDHDGWKVAAGVAAGIAVGTMLARPPASYTTVVVGSSSYYVPTGSAHS